METLKISQIITKSTTNHNLPNRVDAWLNENSLLLIPGDNHRVKQQLRGLLNLWQSQINSCEKIKKTDLNLWLVVPLHLLAGEVLQAHGGLQGALHADQVGLQGG